MSHKNVYIIGGVRTPFMRSMTAYKNVTAQKLMEASLKGLVHKFKLNGLHIGDVGLGAVMNSSANWNLARECVLSTELAPSTPAYNLQRACGTSLETTLQIANKISLGQIDSGIAGGVDTNSDLPIMVSRGLAQKLLHLNSAKSLPEKLSILAQLRPSDFKPQLPAVVEPRTKMSMGQHCEKMVKEWKISRREQDEIAYASHQSGTAAYIEGFYDDLLIEFLGHKKDGTLRPDTSIEKLALLKPVFDSTSGQGTLTAGNSSPLTDGSSAVLLASEEEAQKHNWPLLARFVDGEVSAVDFVNGEGLLIAPTIAVGRLLKRHGLTLQDFDYYEIHEAFAGQVLCTLNAWESDEYCKKHLGTSALGSIDRKKMNVKGGSLAMGHPFAATGGRIVASLAKLLSVKNAKKQRGLISICTAGGMGVAAILESV